jgi:nitrogen fixation NifU-like protein
MDSARQADWKDLLIEHSQFPRGCAELPAPSHQGKGDNPLCGDRVTVQLSVDDGGRIDQVACLPSGCAISIASASMLAERVRGLSVAEADELFGKVRAMLTEADAGPSTEIGDLEALCMVRQYPSRVKCATLAWHALRQALQGDREAATTE